MVGEKLTINENQETKSEKITLNINENKGEFVYGGQHVIVSHMSNQTLLACPREIPGSDEGYYLLNMINELRGVYDKVTEGGKLGEIYISALVELDNIVHTIAIGKGGEVQITPMVIKDYEGVARVIRWADMVEIEPTKGDYMVYRGDYVTVFEGEGGLLQAYIHGGLGLNPRKAMLFGVGELLREYKRITWGRDNKVIEIRGLISHKGLVYRPMIYGHNKVVFRLVSGDYVGLVKGAELILFTRSNC